MKSVLLVFCCLLPLLAQEHPRPVLMVVANQDFYYPDYAEPRMSIEAAGLEVVVAAASTSTAIPHGGSPTVQPDLALSMVNADDYSAILFVGGWGAASYQYAFEGTYHQASYQGDLTAKTRINQLVNDFSAQEKPMAAICHGVSVLAWARVDGVSPIAGRTVTAYSGTSPSFDLQGETMWHPLTRWHIESNMATMVPSGSVGDPTTSQDDVIVDGNIITAEDFRAGAALGLVLADEIRSNIITEPTRPQPVLMVIANQDFYYQEYGDTREGLEARGIQVVVAAETLAVSFPHAGTGEPAGFEGLEPDLELANVDATDYSAIVFVGGWGSSQYQYSFPGTYLNHTYAGNSGTKQVVNDLINDFVDQDKWVSAICFGVSVLAWARVDGTSPLYGKQVCTYQAGSPALMLNGTTYPNNGVAASWHATENGAQPFAPNSLGASWTAVDDVWVDTSHGINVITAQNWDSARFFGETIAQALSAQ
ncbi:MAG: DJ-1/PfpI family protein [Acidobacteria bacterium]|nr:DJ-1/PfpI family protein [Acidobacteriota bacterium]